MRRTLVVTAFVGPLCLFAAQPWAASARSVPTLAGATNAATCAFSSYTLTGTFSRIGGNASFSLHSSGTCVGTSGSVTVDLAFSSVGPWSCGGGFALGSGAFQPSNGVPQSIGASLTNAGGEYVVELHGVTAAAGGQFTTLPVPCYQGQTTTTIGGSGTLTFAAT
jgi:hypothetical protein